MSSQHLFFNSQRYQSTLAGPRIIITGAVHGNEICGTQAIRRVIAEIDAGIIQIISGCVTFVPVTNPLAYQRGERQGDRNLNRRLLPTSTPTEFEDHVANWLCPLLAENDVLLDLHSFRGEGEAFVLVGPENNDGDIEPFSHAEAELAMARCLGVHRMVDGWLSTYARGVVRRQQRLGPDADARMLANANTQFGVGTTEYMRSVGGYAVTLECGQHLDPQAPEVAYRAIINTLTHLGIIAGTAPAAVKEIETLRIYDVIDKLHDDDHFVREWRSFDEVKKGDLIGLRHDGSEVRAEMDGRMIFPDAGAHCGEEWFYITRYSDRIQEGNA
ncbi:succinylglutamate desuccinylase/aspartoacylase family protein [Undibacterium sp. FT79W]|uniref:succinylglutamate desuccinylase/aspartoacylase family protein n=1 Tax=Undibacterium sp. FT79W TaxID=2762296 RepID=UPI00164AD45D|nr:succinylglutamate desuccinylase/aspartoacylase family protein [Undibacterium sp. FT79W]MBC3876464.1 succinylglutamate desuccinylase/aspartoacylase family protein [Undibacterium sp. FT79W]